LGFGISFLFYLEGEKLRRSMYATGPRAKLGFRVTSALVSNTSGFRVPSALVSNTSGFRVPSPLANITYIPTVSLSSSLSSFGYVQRIL
jgi:hypothetical protein